MYSFAEYVIKDQVVNEETEHEEIRQEALVEKASKDESSFSSYLSLILLAVGFITIATAIVVVTIRGKRLKISSDDMIEPIYYNME
jgi:hypothetical protein